MPPTSRRPSLARIATAVILALSLLPPIARGHDEEENEGGSPAARRLAAARCTDGTADDFPCRRIDLLSLVPLSELGASRANDIWGWTDPATGTEYALIGLLDGVGIVDLGDPEAPVVVGRLPTRTVPSTWRDLKVFDDHLFVVSEAADHGLQIFDLTRLRRVDDPPATFSTTASYTRFGSAHNLAINEESGFAYAVGTGFSDGCAGGLHMIDISRPTAPRFAGSFAGDGYTHDAQCVIYDGPDTDHTGKEICFAANEDTLTIVDVTDKQLPVMLSRTGYAGVGYAHQGWLSDDQRFFLSNDELDEDTFGHPTRTYVWDVRDLDLPRVAGVHEAATAASDHNLYIRGRLVFQANYRAGLRILELSDPAAGRLRERGFFDVYPADDAAGFDGAWSVYPFFDSGVVVVSARESGLFVLRPRVSAALSTRVAGVDTDRVSCRDLTERDSGRLELDGARRWDCRDSGLALVPGSQLRQDIRATASGSRVSGRVAGLVPRLVRCRNLTTGRRVDQRSDSRRFDCTELGLEIAPGDSLRLQIWGEVR